MKINVIYKHSSQHYISFHNRQLGDLLAALCPNFNTCPIFTVQTLKTEEAGYNQSLMKMTPKGLVQQFRHWRSETITNYLTPWCTDLWKPTVTQLVKKFLPLYGTWRSITVFTEVHNWTTSWARMIQLTQSYNVFKILQSVKLYFCF
jgi:hypothetical protein